MEDEKQEYLQAWKSLHSGVDPGANVWVRGYLQVMLSISRLLSTLKVSPNTFTLVSGISIIASSGYFLASENLLAIAMLAFIGLLLDGVDGSLAILQGRASKFGAVLDSVNDRIQESILYISVSWILFSSGFSLWITTALLLSLTATLLLEYARTRAQVEVKVTIWERPTRVIVITFFVITASWFKAFDAELLYAMSALAMVLSGVGLYQQFQDAKRQLV
jgi:CDP-diacylglycerol--glycerol-3-phosphate 3-phosphatidyltransferase